MLAGGRRVYRNVFTQRHNHAHAALSTLGLNVGQVTYDFRVVTHSRASNCATEPGCQLPPRGVAIPRSLRAAAMARMVVTPLACSSATVGARSAARASARATRVFWLASRCSAVNGVAGTAYAAAVSRKRYTDARHMLSFLAISVGRLPCAFNSRTRAPSIEAGRPL
jgi:hypothetical protein